MKLPPQLEYQWRSSSCTASIVTAFLSQWSSARVAAEGTPGRGHQPGSHISSPRLAGHRLAARRMVNAGAFVSCPPALIGLCKVGCEPVDVRLLQSSTRELRPN